MIMMIVVMLLSGCLAQDFAALDGLVKEQIDQRVFPGAVIGIYHKGIEYLFKYGNSEYQGDPESFPILKTTIFDLASVSKVVGCTVAAMHLWENQQLDIDEQVSFYLDGFPHEMTIRNLLLHNSGLPADAPYGIEIRTRQWMIDWLYNESKLQFAPGTKYLYSDVNMVALQLIIEKISSQGLDTYLNRYIYEPLQMRNTMFNPPATLRDRIAPTQRDNLIRHKLIWGEVHDPTAFYMNGVSGNAGVFSNVYDLLTYMKMMLGQTKLFKKETLLYWTTFEATSYQHSRALGWDTVPIQTYPPCGHKFSSKSFGHTGYTGTSVWADRNEDLIIIILTNRVYPDDKASVVKFRSDASDLIYDILTNQ